VVMGLIALSYMGVMAMLARRMYATTCNLFSVSEENRGLRTAQQEHDLRMARYFENAPGFFYTTYMDSDGKSGMPFASAGIHALFGVTVEDVAASLTPLFARVHADDVGPLTVARDESLKKLLPLHVEFRINHPEQGERWIELNSLPQREADGATIWHGFMQDITERKRMEDALAAREREFRSLAGNLPENIARFDTLGRYLYINPTHERTLGVSADEVIGTEIPATHERVKAAIAQVVATGQAVEIVRQPVPVDGEMQIHEVSLVPECDAAGRLVSVLGMGRDMTAIYRMQEIIEAREQEFRSLAENLPVAVIRYDAGCRRRYVNPAAERMLHGSAAGLLGQVPGEGGVPATPAMIEHYRRKMEEVLATGEARECDFALDALPVERQEHYEVLFVPEYGADGQTVGVLAIWYDLTERKREQQQLELLNQAVNQSSDAVILIAEDLRFTYVNDAACRSLGYAREELLGMTPPDIDPSVTREMCLAMVDETMAGKAQVLESWHRTKDGRLFPVEISGCLVEHGGVKFSLTVSRDISERKQMDAAREAALAEAQHLAQLRSAFMAQMSHELRTPLNGILGYTQILLSGDALAEKQLAGLNIIQHSGEHLLSLINGLLDHAAIEADKFELIFDDIELEPFLAAIIGIIRVRAEQKNLSFACDADTSLPAVVRGDAQRLRQILLNL
ncbi:MAG TPA: PAS domain S-box protein, partial [Gallionella sp.]|nr:PAS domain S-box protein [Gallionella sp.]